MKKVFIALMAAATLGLSSCSDPTFDKNDPAGSMKAISESLSNDKKVEFAKACAAVGVKSALTGEDPSAKMHGKTADEIIEMAK